ncbi:MAG: hypothetical protein RSB21_08215 [Eubacterium sp.]
MNTVIKKIKMKMNAPFYYKMIVLLFVLFVISPFLITKGIPLGNDASFHLSRVSSLAEALKNGVIFPGVYADYFNGSGYGTGLFYPDLFLYIPAFLMFMGFSNIVAYKIFLILLTVAMAVSMYWSVKQIWQSDLGAMISTLFYLLCSFYRTDLYLRSSVGDLLAFVFIPIIIVGFWQIIVGNEGEWKKLTFGFSGLVLSHILSATIMAILSFIMVICQASVFIREPQRFKALLKATCLSIFLTAFFLFPMIEQIIVNPIWGDTGLLGNIQYWAVPLKDLIFAFPQKLGVKYVPPSGIGFILFTVAIIGIFQLKKNKLVGELCITGLILLFCTSTLFPWKVCGSLFQTLQFPWRLYLFTSIFWCFSSGEIIMNLFLKMKIRGIMIGSMIALLMISFIINVDYIYNNYPPMIINKYPLFAAGCEYLPKYTTFTEIQNSQEKFKSNTQRSNYNKYKIILERNVSNELPIIYYSGYNGQLNGKEIKILKSKNGLCFIENNETGTLMLYYKGTTIRQCSCILSIISFIVLGGFYKVQRKRKKR